MHTGTFSLQEGPVLSLMICRLYGSVNLTSSLYR